MIVLSTPTPITVVVKRSKNVPKKRSCVVCESLFYQLGLSQYLKKNNIVAASSNFRLKRRTLLTKDVATVCRRGGKLPSGAVGGGV